MYFMSLLVNKHCLFFQTLYFAGGRRGEGLQSGRVLLHNLFFCGAALLLSFLRMAIRNSTRAKAQKALFDLSEVFFISELAFCSERSASTPFPFISIPKALFPCSCRRAATRELIQNSGSAGKESRFRLRQDGAELGPLAALEAERTCVLLTSERRRAAPPAPAAAARAPPHAAPPEGGPGAAVSWRRGGRRGPSGGAWEAEGRAARRGGGPLASG